MKNNIFFAYVVLCILMLVGCASAGVNPSDTSTAPSIESTAPTTTEPQGDPYCGLRIGMSKDEFTWSYPKNEWAVYSEYYYLVNSANDAVIFTFDDQKQIDDIQIIPQPDVPITSETFSLIKEGMTFLDVVSLVGLPKFVDDSGISNIVYYTEDGFTYHINIRPRSGTLETLKDIISYEYTITAQLGDEKYGGISVGLLYKDFRRLVSETKYFRYAFYHEDYIFMRNEDGGHVVARIKLIEDEQFTKVECYAAASINPSPENFEKIPYGADLFSVVSMVGIPHHISVNNDSGHPTLCYIASDGTKYELFLQQAGHDYHTGKDYESRYVTEVRRYEET